MDKQWIDKFLDGDLFMRSLQEFGAWSVTENRSEENLKSGIQKDVSEGTVKTVDTSVGDEFFNAIDPKLRKVIKRFYYIDQDQYQYAKLFCMYGLTYLTDKKYYEKPDKRLMEFGDTAAIIYNPNEFLRRAKAGLYNQYGDNVNFKIDEVRYYPPNYYGGLDEFCKPASYSWQNEIRMRVYLLDKNETITDEATGEVRKMLINDIKNINVNIGEIRDICTEIRTEELIDLKLPEFINKYFEIE